MWADELCVFDSLFGFGNVKSTLLYEREKVTRVLD